jgi:3D (Asp-Asp-Asp) domain-containing protein
MKIYIVLLYILIGIAIWAVPSEANAGLFDWFSSKKIEVISPSNAFVDQNIGMGLSEENPVEIKPAEKLDMQLMHNTALIAISNPVAIKRIMPTTAKTYVVTATAYSSTVDQTDDSPFITARGTHVRDGIVAANFLPFGTIIRIPAMFGDKTFVVEDRMHSRFSNRVDIWFTNREDALEFGLRKIRIGIVS